MKKNKSILEFLGLWIVTMLFFTTVVKAEDTQILLEGIHNQISTNNRLNVNSIGIDRYEESAYYVQCLADNSHGTDGERMCLNSIYRLIVNSYLNYTFEKSDDIYLNVENCNFESNTCDIALGNADDSRTETYDITFVGEYDDNEYNNLKIYSSNLKSKYYLADMYYINQLLNLVDEEGSLLDMMYNNYKIFKSFPEIKQDLEKNPKYKYVPVTLGFGGAPLMYGGEGVVVIYNNGLAMDISGGISYNTLRYVYVPDTTENTTDAYIAAALNRIREYINNDDYTISIRYEEENAIDLCGDEYNGYCDESNVLNYVFNDTETYMVRPYILTINNVDYDLAIVPVANSYIKQLDVNSKDYNHDISIETNSSDVPLDTSVGALDVTNDYKNKGFFKAFDINLYSDIKGMYISKIQDGVVVRIPVFGDYNKEYVNIYHIKDDGQTGDKYQAKIEVIDGKKYAVFVTDHFSIYAIENANTIDNPKTFDGIGISIFWAVVSLIGLIAVAIYYKKRNKVRV